MVDQSTAYGARRLDGKVAFITGAGRGVGRAAALHLARLGADIAMNDIDLASARAVGEEIEVEASVNVIEFLATDLSAYLAGQVLVADGGWIDLNPSFPSGNFVTDPSLT